MNKIFYEYEYTFGSTVASEYRLVVEKETEKMLYGKRFIWDTPIENFAIKKESLNLNKIKEYNVIGFNKVKGDFNNVKVRKHTQLVS